LIKGRLKVRELVMISTVSSAAYLLRTTEMYFLWEVKTKNCRVVKCVGSGVGKGAPSSIV